MQQQADFAPPEEQATGLVHVSAKCCSAVAVCHDHHCLACRLGFFLLMPKHILKWQVLFGNSSTLSHDCVSTKHV